MKEATETASTTTAEIITFPTETTTLYAGQTVTKYHVDDVSDSNGEPNRKRFSEMDDKDVRRLEDRIEAVNRESQLRLEVTLARIETSTARIIEQTAAMRQELQEQRADARALRSEVRADIAGASDVTRSWGTWIIATILVVVALLTGVELGLRQFWASGVQVGQAMHSSDPVAPQSTPSSQVTAPAKHT